MGHNGAAMSFCFWNRAWAVLFLLVGIWFAFGVWGNATAAIVGNGVDQGRDQGRASDGANPIVRRDTPSGYPVPRFVELANEPTNCRVGPSKQHPPKFIFQRRHVPLLVIAETRDNWRRVRDVAGDECWVHSSTIHGATHVMVRDSVTLLARPSHGAKERGVLEGGVIAKRKQVKGDWVLVSVDAVRGWMPADGLWGVAP